MSRDLTIQRQRVVPRRCLYRQGTGQMSALRQATAGLGLISPGFAYRYQASWTICMTNRMVAAAVCCDRTNIAIFSESTRSPLFFLVCQFSFVTRHITDRGFLSGFVSCLLHSFGLF